MHTRYRTLPSIRVLAILACVSCGADPANEGTLPANGGGTGGVEGAQCASPPCAMGGAAAPASCGDGMTPCGSDVEQTPPGEGPPPVVGLEGAGGITGGMVPLPDPVAPIPVPSAKCGGGTADGRHMECLDRGVVAVPSGANTFVSWRLFGSDPANVAFRLYRQNGGEAPALVCETGANAATSCLDPAAGGGASYFVRPVIDGVEGDPSGAAARLDQDYLRIPLRPASAGAFVHLGWVGDLDGDGEYEVVVDRISAEAPLVDAYTRHGEFLWRLNTGRLGVNQNNIEGGAATISNGHWDGLTVYDFDSDGFAEIAIKTANGFVFGDGTSLNAGTDQDQFVSIVDGRTGAEVTRAPLPDDYLSDGPLQCHFGVGYFDGVHPSVLTKCKNRIGNGGFNLVGAAYDFDGSSLTRRWKFTRNNGNGGADYHQIRVLDVDGDGKDELADGGYVVDDDGSVLYALGGGVVHGDRFHITDMDPARPGLEGWGIQQDNANGLETYYYDAATGEMLRTYANPNGPGADMGRGTVADLFPDQPGLEYWSFNGMFSAGTGALIVAEQDANVAWPNFVMQWDGDVGGELLDNNRVGDWDTVARSRNSYSWRRTFDGLVQARGAIPFYGDIFGDWREEALLESTDNTELRIYTTTFETSIRLYTLVHNPAYRNGLTVHGYKQSHLVDYFLGYGMATPPAPSIRLVSRP
jgi:rhamnogalacturonan endolyase